MAAPIKAPNSNNDIPSKANKCFVINSVPILSTVLAGSDEEAEYQLVLEITKERTINSQKDTTEPIPCCILVWDNLAEEILLVNIIPKIISVNIPPT